MEEDKSFSLPSDLANHAEDSGHGWQKVTYPKKQRKNQSNKTAADSSKVPLPSGSGIVTEKNSVFKGLEKHAEERRRKLEAQRAASAVYDDDDGIPVRSKKNRGEDDDDDDDYASSDAKENNAAEANKKEKPKKAKKPKITVAEAAAKIDANDLAAFLSSVSVFFYFFV